MAVLNHRITPHLSYAEVVRSQTATRLGIDNLPSSEHLENIRLTAEKLFEPLRALVSEERGKSTPLYISSFYRCPDLNRAIGGSAKSQHCLGQAIDLDIDGWYDDFDNADLFYLIEEELEFDQLIWEFGDDFKPAWVHVSYSRDINRGIILRARRVNGKVEYIKY
ncbi:MAG: D-Ala-D-Ala carboxypeptidase family metallohydrolase [Cyclobacteriaceae bacterium]